jgi:Tfp pilus assembly protein PilF
MVSMTRTPSRDTVMIAIGLVFLALLVWEAVSVFRPMPPMLSEADQDLRAGRTAAAQAKLEKFIAANPTSPEVYDEACQLELKYSQWAPAEMFARRGVQACKYAEDNEQRSILYRDLSWALANLEPQHPQKRAVEAAQHALELNPHDAAILNEAGFLMADNDIQIPQAHAYIEEALRLARKDTSNPEAVTLTAIIMDSYGWVLYKEHKTAQAIDMLTQAINMLPESRAAAETLKVEYYHLGAAYVQANRPDDARRALSVALRYDPDFEPAKTEFKRLAQPATPTSGARVIAPAHGTPPPVRSDQTPPAPPEQIGQN